MKLGVIVACVLMVPAAASWLRFGSVHPCGILKASFFDTFSTSGVDTPSIDSGEDGQWFDRQTAMFCAHRLWIMHTESVSTCALPSSDESVCEQFDPERTRMPDL